MSDSVRPHRWQPTRLRRPWDSPGKNTGAGCHFLLQCVKVKSESEGGQVSDLEGGTGSDGKARIRTVVWPSIRTFSVTCISETWSKTRNHPARVRQELLRETEIRWFLSRVGRYKTLVTKHNFNLSLFLKMPDNNRIWIIMHMQWNIMYISFDLLKAFTCFEINAH